MDLFAGLRHSYLTVGLSDEDVRALADLAEEVEHGDLEEIVRFGADATEFFVLLRGKAVVQSADGQPMSRLQPYAIIGETALLARGPRTATVTSDGGCVLAKFDSGRTDRFMEAHPKVGIALLRNIGATVVERLRSANLQLERLLVLEGF
jgi:CRP-like cAMP-binding protein